MVKLNDIITNEDGSVYADTAIWCNQNGATLREIEPIEKEVEEEYTEQIEVEHEQLIPERSHKEMVAAVFDAEGNETEPEKEITVIDEEEHTETFTTTEEVTKTRTVKKTFRQFKVVAIPEPTVEEKNEQIRMQRQARFTQESDPLKLDYDEAVARNEETAEEKKQVWLAKKDQIRDELPYVE